jgi:heterotetrameric sarcosine oxidase gamma subunit
VAESNLTAPLPVARSPIRPVPPVREHAGWEVSATSSSAPLRVADLTALTKVRVRAGRASAAAAVLACPFGSTRREGGSLVVGSGPDEWLLLSPAGTASPIVERLASGEGATTAEGFVSVVDVTHAGVVIRVTGESAADLLSRVCAINLADAVAPNGSAFRSSVARVICDVVRHDLDGTRSYLLHSDRSSGQYLFDSLLEVGAEFDIGVDGYPDKEI